MFRAYLRLLAGRARARRGQTLLSLVVTACAAALLLLAVLVRGSAGAPFEQLLDRAGGPHVTVYSSSPDRIDTAIGAIADLIDHEAFTASIANDGSLTIDGRTHPLQFWSLVTPDGAPAGTIGGAGRLVHGRWLAGPGEIVIDDGLARTSGLAVGDAIAVAGPGDVSMMTVVGTAIVTTRAPYPLWDPAAVFVAPGDLATLVGDAPTRLAVGLRLRDAATVDEATFRFIRLGEAGPGGTVSLSQWTSIRDSIADEITGNVLVLQTFGGFALVAALLIIGNLAAARLIADRRDVGLLKAIGLTPRGVGLLYVTELTALAGGAAALGVALAFVAAPLFLAPVTDLLHTAPGVAWPAGPIAAVFAAVVGFAALSSLVPAVQAARLATVPALSARQTGRGPVSRLARLAATLRAPLSIRTGLGDAFARPVRAWLTILAIAMLGATAAATLTFEATVNGFVEHPERTGIPPFDLVAATTGGDRAATIDRLLTFAAGRDDVVAAVTTDEVRMDVPVPGGRAGSFDRVLARSLGGDVEQSGIPIVSGRLPTAVSQAAVGLGLARRWGIAVGDQLETKLVSGDDQLLAPVRVVGIVVEHSNSGRVLLVTHDTIAAATGAPPVPREVALRLAPGTDSGAVRAAIAEAFGAAVQVDESRARQLTDITDVRDQLRPVMLSLNGLLFGIAALNLMIVLVIAIGERRRDLATMRAIGFTPRQIVTGILASAAVLGAAGVALGAPAGYAVVRWLLGGIAADEGWAPGVVATPSAGAWALLAVVAVAVAVAAAAVPSWIATRGAVSAGLRSE